MAFLFGYCLQNISLIGECSCLIERSAILKQLWIHKSIKLSRLLCSFSENQNNNVSIFIHNLWHKHTNCKFAFSLKKYNASRLFCTPNKAGVFIILYKFRVCSVSCWMAKQTFFLEKHTNLKQREHCKFTNHWCFSYAVIWKVEKSLCSTNFSTTFLHLINGTLKKFELIVFFRSAIETCI